MLTENQEGQLLMFLRLQMPEALEKLLANTAPELHQVVMGTDLRFGIPQRTWVVAEEFCRDNERIKAIKALRLAGDMGLREAKDFIDTHFPRADRG